MLKADGVVHVITVTQPARSVAVSLQLVGQVHQTRPRLDVHPARNQCNILVIGTARDSVSACISQNPHCVAVAGGRVMTGMQTHSNNCIEESGFGQSVVDTTAIWQAFVLQSYAL